MRRSSRFLVLILGVVTLALAFSGCNIINDSTYRLNVQNNCVGDNSYVYVYVDGNYEGIVYASGSFSGISYGNHGLEADGTGAYGSVFTRTVFFSSDVTWTLCP